VGTVRVLFEQASIGNSGLVFLINSWLAGFGKSAVGYLVLLNWQNQVKLTCNRNYVEPRDRLAGLLSCSFAVQAAIIARWCFGGKLSLPGRGPREVKAMSSSRAVKHNTPNFHEQAFCTIPLVYIVL